MKKKILEGQVLRCRKCKSFCVNEIENNTSILHNYCGCGTKFLQEIKLR